MVQVELRGQISRYSCGTFDGEDIQLPTPKIDIVPEVESYVKKFYISVDDMELLRLDFESSMVRGLSDDVKERESSTLKMLPTFIHDTLHPSRTGLYPALDLGGTNLRFFRINLNGTNYTYEAKTVKLPDICMTGTADDLFDFMADVLYQGLSKIQEPSEYVPAVGFTFSFPTEQTSLFNGTLITWTKGFKTAGVEGEDVAELMHKAAKKKGLNIGKFVLINDTAGTLLAGALNDTSCVIGVINGTGSNACYMEDLGSVPKWTDRRPHLKEIIINIEWGAFGDKGEADIIRTKYDLELDAASIRPGLQRFEKMISGMYLGEVARYCIIDLVKANLLFGGVLPKSILEPYSLETKHLSNAYCIPTLVQEFKDELGIVINKQDANVLSCLFDAIVYRAAQLTSITLSVLINRTNRTISHIAADGSMFKRNPVYLQYCHGMIKYLVENKEFDIVLTTDGSGRGAALAAAVSDAASVRHLRI